MSVDRGFCETEISALWSAFASNREAARRQDLLLHYLPFARIMAAKLYATRTFLEVEFDDYLQYARLGLLEAIDRFEPDRGFKFETYGAQRIRGAILSGMEVYSEMHEQAAARKRIVQQRLETLTADEDSTLAAPSDVFAQLAELAMGLAVGFALEDSGLHMEPDQERTYQDNTFAGLEMRQLRAQIQSLLEQLPVRQRQVMQYHYLQQLPFEEIAAMLEVTSGRISQLHKGALLALRAAWVTRPGIDWSG